MSGSDRRGFSPVSHDILLRSSDARMKDTDQLVGFAQDKRQNWSLSCPTFPFYESGPTASLAKFFQTDFEFVNKILSGLSSLCFTVVWIRRRSGAEDLSGNVVSCASLGKFL